MPTDEERREVARRLREINVDSIGHGYELLEEVANCIGCEGVKYGTSYGQFVVLLADLIDPQASEQTNQRESSLSASPIDRGALLELANELEEKAQFARASTKHAVIYAGYAREYESFARRIREACGVVES